MELLAICLANIFTANDPHVVVLGGGLSNFDAIYQEMPKRIPHYLMPVAKCPKIIKLSTVIQVVFAGQRF